MNKFVLLFCVTGLLFNGCESLKTDIADLRLGIWDYHWMNQVKHDLKKKKSEFYPAFEKLLNDAENALNGVYSVTFKNLIPPGGSKNDYMSIGPYWWPDPNKPDGLPYIRRDGEINSERDKLDSPQMSKMINAVRSLSLAWFFTDNYVYAKKAEELLRVWFLEPETMMTPHLKYSQAIPGIIDGRSTGIIDGRSFAELTDAIALLETSPALTETEKIALRRWFAEYFQWLTKSEFGKETDKSVNNLSIAYDVQTCGIAYFLGNDGYVKQKVSEIPKRRIDSMIEADGGQPYELARTLSFGYSLSNLNNFFNAGIK